MRPKGKYVSEGRTASVSETQHSVMSLGWCQRTALSENPTVRHLTWLAWGLCMLQLVSPLQLLTFKKNAETHDSGAADIQRVGADATLINGSN